MTSKAKTIFIRDKVYVPVTHLDLDSVREHYTLRLYEEQACLKCPYLEDRHSYLCDTCEGFKGATKTYRRKEVRGTNYIGLPIGDKRNFTKVTGLSFSDFVVKDLRVLAPFQHKIKFTASLRDYQEPLTESFLRKKYGLIEAPPRTGKTLVMLYLCLELGQRTLILADQHEFLRQFEYHITGHAKSGTPKCTNLPELEQKLGKKLYGYPKTDEDFDNFQFFIMPYQQFLSEKQGRDRFRKVSPNIGTIAVDEVHSAAATEFSKVVAKFPSRYKFGVTATVTRKDGKHAVIKHILGPVVARSSREALLPIVYVHETEFVPKAKYASGRSSWVYAMQALAKDKKRNRMIVDQVMRDLDMGHNIVIPVMFKNHVFELQRLINERWEDIICETFTGGGGDAMKLKREKILNAVKRSKVRVVVGIRRMLQRGLNVPQWSAIYEVAPISNKPNLMQETSRIRTPLEGKSQPIIRLFIDPNLGQSLGCGRNTIHHMQDFKYAFSDKKDQRRLVKTILSTGRRRGNDHDDVDAQFKPVKADVGSRGLFGTSSKRF